jgi:nitroreductase
MIEVILDRRSIRRFVDRPVPMDMIETMVKAAMYAPSAGNQQPWQFVVVKDRALLDAVPGVHPHAAMVPSAAGVIIVCGDLSKERHKEMWVQDCSAATQNILLAAQAQGLGAVWLGVYPREDRVSGCRKLFGIPEGIVPFSMVAFGWPAEVPPRPERFDSTRIHCNRW